MSSENYQREDTIVGIEVSTLLFGVVVVTSSDDGGETFSDSVFAPAWKPEPRFGSSC